MKIFLSITALTFVSLFTFSPAKCQMVEDCSSSENHNIERFFLAIMKDNTESILNLLKQDQTLSLQTNRCGDTGLMTAIWHNKMDAFDTLLSRSTINTSNNFGKTALFYIATSPLIQDDDALIFTQKLIAKNASLNVRDSFYSTALIEATRNTKLKMVRELCSHGADIYYKDILGKNALHHAAEHGHDAIVNVLLQYYITQSRDIDAQDNTGWTPLMYAASDGHDTVVALLLATGADLFLEDSNEDTALVLAARNGRTHVVQQLLGYYQKLHSVIFEAWADESNSTVPDEIISLVQSFIPYTESLNRAGMAALTEGHIAIAHAIKAVEKDFLFTAE